LDRTTTILEKSQMERRKRDIQRQIDALQSELNALETPAVIRRALFGARVATANRDEAVRRACAELGLSRELLESHLFADLPSQRRLAPLGSPMSPTALALLANQAMVTSLLQRATLVTIRAEGDVRSLVRAAKLRGLLCTAAISGGKDRVRLDVSGPYALFRHTQVYGHALSSLIPRAARCHCFELLATCVLGSPEDIVEFTVRSGDPVIPAAPGRAFDSKVEERFARDFSRLALDFDLLREPEAVAVDGAWIFPDFLIRHRRHPERAFHLEIIGFWTPEYLDRKLRSLSRAGLSRLILCVDQARNCGEGELPPHAEGRASGTCSVVLERAGQLMSGARPCELPRDR
jgi:predicted nuclease of restriction endonuclease-like RecB superfamily